MTQCVEPSVECDSDDHVVVVEHHPGRPRWRLPIVLGVAGYLLFCHGCHGDHDNELLAWLASWF